MGTINRDQLSKHAVVQVKEGYIHLSFLGLTSFDLLAKSPHALHQQIEVLLDRLLQYCERAVTPILNQPDSTDTGTLLDLSAGTPYDGDQSEGTVKNQLDQKFKRGKE